MLAGESLDPDIPRSWQAGGHCWNRAVVARDALRRSESERGRTLGARPGSRRRNRPDMAGSADAPPRVRRPTLYERVRASRGRRGPRDREARVRLHCRAPDETGGSDGRPKAPHRASAVRRAKTAVARTQGSRSQDARPSDDPRRGVALRGFPERARTEIRLVCRCALRRSAATSPRSGSSGL